MIFPRRSRRPRRRRIWRPDLRLAFSSLRSSGRERCAARVPGGAYFDAVAEAIEAAGVVLGDWYRDEDRAVIYEIDPSDVHRGPLAVIAPRGLFVGWLRPALGGLAGLAAAGGWFWVPCSRLTEDLTWRHYRGAVDVFGVQEAFGAGHEPAVEWCLPEELAERLPV